METTSSEVHPLFPTAPAYNNAIPQEINRVLFAWLDPDRALEARSSLIDDTPENHLKALEQAQAQLDKRSVFAAGNPVTELVEHELAQEIKARPQFSYIESEVLREDPDANCRIAMVDLNGVLAIQPSVRVDNLESRLFQRSPDIEQLFAMSFPDNAASDNISIDVNERGYTVSALDPNVRVVPWSHLPQNPPLALPQYKLQYPAAQSALPLQLFPFALLRMPNYLQVVHYQDRYFLRNGYNRAASLLYQQIATVPCFLIETQEEDLIGFKPNMLDPEVVFGDYPPYLSDFWRDEVTCLWQTAILRRVYHMTLEEIKVWR